MDIGALRHRIVLENPGTPVPDGDGGFTQTWQPLFPSPVWASVAPASSRDLERVGARSERVGEGSAISTATHIVMMRYHSGVTTKTRITFHGRTFNVTGVANPDERNIETVALAVEVVP
jgi:SPP1 family predicted phage head-tail adaptor